MSSAVNYRCERCGNLARKGHSFCRRHEPAANTRCTFGSCKNLARRGRRFCRPHEPTSSFIRPSSAISVAMNHCASSGCKNLARRGHNLCGLHDQISASCMELSSVYPVWPHSASALVASVNVANPLQNKIDALQRRVDQVSLRLEQEESRKNVQQNLFDTQESRTNQKLRADVESVTEELKLLNAKVKELQHDPILEVAQLFSLLEMKIVCAISDEAVFLSDIDIKNDPAVQLCERSFHLNAKDLFALRSIITTIRQPRRVTAFPEINAERVEKWRERLRQYCPQRITDESIEHLIDAALRECVTVIVPRL